MRTLLAAIVLCIPVALYADHSTEHASHSHGEPDLGNIGKAHLATSCNDAAQQEFDRGVALMHSFWYREAEKSFRKAAAADAKCGMAWWGVAMANLHPLWAPPTPSELNTGVEAAAKAKEIGAPTAREKAYIDAINTYYAESDTRDHRARMLAYEQSMAKLERENPKDREAAIFHALSLIGVAEPKDKSYVFQKKAAGILNRVLPEEPEHPGVAHYLIHSFDYPDLAELALPAARVYAKLAPGSPHALHMPSHIFVRRGLWDESIASNIASAEKARAYVAKTVPGAASFDELHAIDYLVYSYLQKGDLAEAKKLVDLTLNVKKIDNPDQFAAAYAISAVPGRWALERHQWKEAAAIQVPATINWAKVPYAEANLHFSRGIGAARSGELEVARDALARLGAIRQALVEQKNAYWADQVEIQRLGVEAWIAWASNEKENALKLMRAAAELESSTEKHPVTPGAIIPARELLAEMLLESGKRDEASKEIQQVLHDAPNRRNALAIAAKTKS
ncbi:MAG: tetratricopeptide repeat protein [Thermoanaerobaculia bacterium]